MTETKKSAVTARKNLGRWSVILVAFIVSTVILAGILIIVLQY